MVFPGFTTADEALNDREVVQGRYVLYWMQQSQRAEINHALEFAVREANRLGQGVVVAFGLTDDYPEANLRHYTFMLEGLQETERALNRGIRIAGGARLTAGGRPGAGARGQPHRLRLRLPAASEAMARSGGAQAACRVVQVESDVIVPVETASVKAEIGARTLRPRIHRQLAEYLMAFPPVPREHADGQHGRWDWIATRLRASKPSDRPQRLPVSGRFKGGTPEAKPGCRIPQETADALRPEPQPAPDRRYLAHEPLPALRPDLPALHGPRGPGGGRAGGRRTPSWRK